MGGEGGDGGDLWTPETVMTETVYMQTDITACTRMTTSALGDPSGQIPEISTNASVYTAVGGIRSGYQSADNYLCLFSNGESVRQGPARGHTLWEKEW